jgi:predicted ABC-type ATPase
VSEVDRQRYALSEEENEYIFRTDLIPDQLSHAVRQAEPILVVVGGQTGAGKTATTEMISRLLDRRGGVVNNNLDFYKGYHPRYSDLMADDDTTVGAYTSVDGRKWMAKVHAYSIEQRYDVIMESAMTKPADFLEPIQQYRDAGYRVEVAVLAVPEALSRLGVLDRYYGEVMASGRGRVIDSEVHDATYRGVLDAVGLIDRDRLAHHVFVLRRGNETIYANKLDPDDNWTDEPLAQEATQAERTRLWTETETYRFRKSVGPLRQASHTNAHLLPRDWNLQLDRVEELAIPLIPRGLDSTSGLAPARNATAAPNAPPAARRSHTSYARALGRVVTG